MMLMTFLITSANMMKVITVVNTLVKVYINRSTNQSDLSNTDYMYC